MPKTLLCKKPLETEFKNLQRVIEKKQWNITTNVRSGNELGCKSADGPKLHTNASFGTGVAILWYKWD